MINLNLTSVPNQEFVKTIDTIEYNIRIHLLSTGMYVCDIDADGEPLVRATRIMPNSAIIQYPYLKPDGGNFYFKSVNNDYPDYKKFGGEQSMWYYTNEELSSING